MVFVPRIFAALDFPRKNGLTRAWTRVENPKWPHPNSKVGSLLDFFSPLKHTYCRHHFRSTLEPPVSDQPKCKDWGRDPFNQNSDRSDRVKRTTSKGGPVFSKLFRLDRTDPLSFGPKFPEILVEWIAPWVIAYWIWSFTRIEPQGPGGFLPRKGLGT